MYAIPKAPILFVGKHYVVVNKLPGVFSQCPDLRSWRSHRMNQPPILLDIVRSENPDLSTAELRTVHRLDSQVTGGLLLAKTKSAAQNFSKNLREGGNTGFGLVRRYVALVEGDLTPLPMCGTLRFGGMVTKYAKVLSNCIVLQLETGKKHQIRRQLALGLGHPILNDCKYGARKILSAKRQIALHSGFLQTRVGSHVKTHLIPVPSSHRHLWNDRVDKNGTFNAKILHVLSSTTLFESA
ncbi:LAMI_0H18338g1_1 [Lachancea mirantina]|uniref:21S rRNA pseudouridine(2819) synthase n=1 Tax=Lachancea mirantina TaxID=1230905 RepID=A0A1G4KJF8_9SACH|nr:LAMI_0H18338g1_1 [Lachancea mirantina]